MMGAPDSVGPSGRHRWFVKGVGQWTDGAGGVYAGADLAVSTILDDRGGRAGPARSIVWLDAGTLDLVTASGFAAGAAETGLSMPAGTVIGLQVTKIMGTSTCGRVLVMW